MFFNWFFKFALLILGEDGVLLGVGLLALVDGTRLGVFDRGAGDFAKYLNNVFPPGLLDILLFRLDMVNSETLFYNVNVLGLEIDPGRTCGLPCYLFVEYYKLQTK